jgi:hypothetical protein
LSHANGGAQQHTGGIFNALSKNFYQVIIFKRPSPIASSPLQTTKNPFCRVCLDPIIPSFHLLEELSPGCFIKIQIRKLCLEKILCPLLVPFTNATMPAVDEIEFNRHLVSDAIRGALSIKDAAVVSTWIQIPGQSCAVEVQNGANVVLESWLNAAFN